MPVKNRLLILMSEKQASEGRPVTASSVARDTKLTRQVVTKWINNDVKEFRADMIKAFCDYFNCDVGDLIEYDRGAK